MGFFNLLAWAGVGYLIGGNTGFWIGLLLGYIENQMVKKK